MALLRDVGDLGWEDSDSWGCRIHFQDGVFPLMAATGPGELKVRFCCDCQDGSLRLKRCISFLELS